MILNPGSINRYIMFEMAQLTGFRQILKVLIPQAPMHSSFMFFFSRSATPILDLWAAIHMDPLLVESANKVQGICTQGFRGEVTVL